MHRPSHAMFGGMGALHTLAAALAAGLKQTAAREAEPAAPTLEPDGRTGHRPGDRPTTMPRWPNDTIHGRAHPLADCHLNPARQERRRIAEAFRAAHGRPMNPKDWRRLKRQAHGRVPSALEAAAMLTGGRP